MNDRTATARPLRRLLPVGAVVGALVIGSTSTAWAWWTASASVNATVSMAAPVPTINPPTNLRCTDGSAADGWAQLSWTPAGPAPTGWVRTWEVTITRGTNSVTHSFPGTATSAQISSAQMPSQGQGGTYAVSVVEKLTSGTTVGTSTALTGQSLKIVQGKDVRCVTPSS